VKTLEPASVDSNREPRRPSRSPARIGLIVLAALVVVPFAVLLVRSKWGVLFGLGFAAVAGLGLWVMKRGFLFIELVAFLIHFDGIGFGAVRMGRVIAGSALVLLVYKLVVERWRPPAVPPRSWVPVLLMTVWAIAGGSWARNPSIWLWSMGLMFLGFGYFVITAFMVDSHEKLHKYLRAYWYGGLISAASGVFALVVGIRGVGFTTDPNFFGVMIASMIPLTVYYRRTATDQRMKHLYTVLLIFIFVGATGAGSRSGVIGASLAVFGTLITRPGLSGRRRARVGMWALVIALVTFGVMFFANPANTMRGFNDRGAGRLDFWNVTLELIPERPLLGYGGGQIGAEIPTRLPTTPGVEKITDTRDEVSSHNTWLDVTGDYGVIGLAIFVSVYVVMIINLLRPRWRKERNLSTAMLIMMVPVLSGSTLLPLLNNKLAWSIIGLSAALQVPSWGTRYSGYFDPGRSGARGPALAPAGGILDRARSTAVSLRGSRNGGTPADTEGRSDEAELTLARWDLRVSRRFRYYLAVGGLIGMVVFGAVAARVPTNHQAEVGIVAPVLDAPANIHWISVSRARLQVLHTLVMSDAYAAELKELAGLDLPIKSISAHMYVERPDYGPYLRIFYNDTDQARVEQAAPHLIPALESLMAKGRLGTSDTLVDEVRPVYPGEQRYFTGDLFLVLSETPSFGSQPPPVAWATFIGLLTGIGVAMGFQLIQQVRPRVNSGDDFQVSVGMPLLTHVGRVGWRYGATKQQYIHVATSALEMTGGDRMARRIVISGPVSDPASRGLAMGVAAALAAYGQRVVLVDAQAERPWLSARLGAWRRPGLSDVTRGEAELSDTLRRVNRWLLPVSVRRALGRAGDNLRFIPAGRRKRDREMRVDPAVLDGLDPNVTTVLLAPPLLSPVPAAASLRWADVVLYCLVEGRTVTYEAEDGGIRIRTFSTAPSGVVLSDV
jgi:O-antigen ligase